MTIMAAAPSTFLFVVLATGVITSVGAVWAAVYGMRSASLPRVGAFAILSLVLALALCFGAPLILSLHGLFAAFREASEGQPPAVPAYLERTAFLAPIAGVLPFAASVVLFWRRSRLRKSAVSSMSNVALIMLTLVTFGALMAITTGVVVGH